MLISHHAARFVRRTALLMLLISGGASAAEAQPLAGDGPSACAIQEHRDSEFIVCSIEADGIRLFWRGADGEPLKWFQSLADEAQRTGKTLQFAMNAGMYTKDFAPLGLYVENGKQLRPLNTANLESKPGPTPNFYKEPNGVFYLLDGKAGILETDAFAARGITPSFATQSGPMLVIDGALHPALIEGSTDKTRRSGVGICDDGTVKFAISERQVNFHDFALLFRDDLGCANALFLDGGRGVGLYSPQLGRNDISWHGGFGPIFGVVD